MCGIAGYIGKKRINSELLEKVSFSMNHRGPDARNFVEKKN